MAYAPGYTCGEQWQSYAPAGWAVTIELADRHVRREHPVAVRYVIAASAPSADTDGERLLLYSGKAPVRRVVPEGMSCWLRGELTRPNLRVTAEPPA